MATTTTARTITLSVVVEVEVNLDQYAAAYNGVTTGADFHALGRVRDGAQSALAQLPMGARVTSATLKR